MDSTFLLRVFNVWIVWIVIASLNISRASAQETLAGKFGPDTSYLIIRHINITGNKITKPRIIIRELKFKEKDTVSVADLLSGLEISRQNVFNTKLFNFVTIDTSRILGTQLVDLRVSVVERWYIWPVPLFEISERNFNVWWETKDFSRLTYGLDLTFYNVRGRNETMRILAHFGYNQLYGFTYRIPNLNKAQTFGMGAGAGIELNHALSVITINNKPVNKKDSSKYLKKIIYGYTEVQFRPDFHSTHTVRLSYNYYIFGGNVYKIPGFSIVNSSDQWFFTLSYLFKTDRRDASYYPLTGHYFDLELNYPVPYSTAHNSFIKSNLRKYWKISERWYCASGVTGKLSFEKIQPYYLQRGLGYGQDFVRGYEYYVVDGQHFALLKSDLKFALIPQRVVKVGFIKTTKFNTIPLALYVDVFADAGYVCNYSQTLPYAWMNGNTLENSMLGGAGLGIDFTTYYDVVLRVAGSWNMMGQTSITLHFTAPI